MNSTAFRLVVSQFKIEKENREEKKKKELCIPDVLACKQLSLEMARRNCSQRPILTCCQLQREHFSGDACLVQLELVLRCVFIPPSGLPWARLKKTKSRAGSQWEVFLHGCVPPTCSGHRHDWAGKTAQRIRARPSTSLPF